MQHNNYRDLPLRFLEVSQVLYGLIAVDSSIKQPSSRSGHLLCTLEHKLRDQLHNIFMSTGSLYVPVLTLVVYRVSMELISQPCF